MAKRNERLDELCKMLSEKTGTELHWYGCNGEFCISGAMDSYLRNYHSKKDLCLYIEGMLAGMDIVRRKCGMTLQEICNRIAQFTGKKKSEAMRKAKIFRKNCAVPLSKVMEIRMCFGKRTDEDGNRTEDPDWLEFKYRDTDGHGYVFSIID